MKEIGRNLADKMEYTDENGFVYYKTKNQTREGTRKTGKLQNNLYKINVWKRIKR